MFSSAESEDIDFRQWYVPREVELQQVREAFAQGRSCLVTGSIGAGKSAFLRNASVALRHHFSDGTLFLPGREIASVKGFLGDDEVADGSRVLICVDDIDRCGPAVFSDFVAKIGRMPRALVLAATSKLDVHAPESFRKISLERLDPRTVLERRLQGLRAFHNDEIADLVSRATATAGILAVAHHGSVTPREALLAAYNLLSQGPNVAGKNQTSEPLPSSLFGDILRRTDPIGVLLSLFLFMYSTIGGNEHEQAERARHEDLVQLIKTVLVNQKQDVLFVTTGAVNLRETSNCRSHIVTTLPPSTLVTIQASDGQWFHVSASTTNGRIVGWVFNRYLRPIAIPGGKGRASGQ